MSPPAGSFPGFAPTGQPPQGYESAGPEYGQPQQAFDPSQPQQGYGPVEPEYGQPQQAFDPGQPYGQPTQAFNPGQPPYGQSTQPFNPNPPTQPFNADQDYGYQSQPFDPAQEYGQQTQMFNPAQEYGHQTQPFNPGQPYGSAGEAYPAQGQAGYPTAPFAPQREMPSNVYGTPSGPPAQGYQPQGYQPQGFDQQGYDHPTSMGDGDESPAAGSEGGKKRLLLILALVAAIAVLAAIGTAVTLAMGGSSTDFAINDCVKQSGSKAVKTSCSDSGAYKVVNKVTQQNQCPDANQPFVVISHNSGKDEVLCLRPANQK